ncbi:22882_t:CDS:2 [Gigaspora margarita]|uniref:22882_t:CDS:1 n=1 Tax=Gigaspora margarita TaxID=4874 RepID=A0ABN7VE98_GIGMA|nr:22882_t:CDS:2 [Gigaspora margarita]
MNSSCPKSGHFREIQDSTKKEMHEELLRFAHSGEIDKDHMPKVDIIQNWIGQYSREFNQKGTVIELEAFKAMSS